MDDNERVPRSIMDTGKSQKLYLSYRYCTSTNKFK